MIKKFEILKNLQEIDLKIEALEQDKVEVPKTLEGLKSDWQRFKDELTAEKEKLDELEKKRKKLEREVADEETRIEQSETRLMESKSNEQYKACLKEIESLKTEKVKKEETVLNIMVEIEGEKERFKKNEEDFKTKEQEFQKQEKELTIQLNSVDKLLLEEGKKRETVAHQTDGDFLAVYQRLKKRKPGQVVVSPVGGRCPGCNLNIPSQLYNQVMKREELIICPNCARILVWEGEI